MIRIPPRLQARRLAPVLLALLITVSTRPAACAPDLSGADYRNRVQPFLTRNCSSCHNDKLKTGNLSLERPSTDPVLWRKVLEKLRTGRMPPPGAPKPDTAALQLVTGWIEKAFPQEMPNPGRVTAHRLNRAEYNNTVRDLVGVSIHPADEFPLDDAGYGFDNIADVLSVSPLLMEKYIAAAKRISRVAVYGEPHLNKPTKLVRYMSKKSQDDPTPGALPYSERGAIYGSFDVPVDGEYEFHMRDANYRPRETGSPLRKELSRKRNLTEEEKRELAEENRKAYPPVRMVMTLDAKQILTEVVEGNIDYQYAHGEAVARVRIASGEHFFRASYPEFADMANPRDNVNLDGRRKLFIDYVDIVGPFNPSGEPPSRSKIFICSDQSSECAARIIETLGHRAYRRPLTGVERKQLIDLAGAVRRNGDSFDESIRVALEAMLVSPNFLLRIERQPDSAGPSPISEYDLASRLSYFLWSTMPDEELMRAADAHRLRQPGVLESEVRRMLADPKADALVDNFVSQWLGLRLLDRRKPDPAHFPTVDDELLDAMRRETTLFSRGIMREDRSVLDFIDARFTYLNGPLARHYGIPGVNGEAFQRVGVATDQRGGVLSQASVLTLSSYATRTSPVLRGKWVLENLLGTPPPPPPPDVPALKEENLGTEASVRQRLEQHRANPACAVCHNQMDPIGFGLENYDASGAWREKDGKFPIDSSGKLPGGVSFQGPAELKQVLVSQKDLLARNLTEKMLTYALGRGLESYDAPAVDGIMKELASNQYRLSSLVFAIVKSEPFQMRAGADAERTTKGSRGTNGAI
jgi:hypothetical protein